jgi:hypothetical protein
VTGCRRNPRLPATVLPSCCDAHHRVARDRLVAAVMNDAIAAVGAWVHDGCTPDDAVERARAYYSYHLIAAVELGIAVGGILVETDA